MLKNINILMRLLKDGIFAREKMFRSILPTLVLLVFCSVFSRAENSGKIFLVTIRGTIKNFSGQQIYLHHKWDNKDYTDSAFIDRGKFVFKVKSTEPNMYWFTLSREMSAQPNVIFFADEAEVKARLVGDSLANSVVEGGLTQRNYQEYKIIGLNFTAKQQDLQSAYTLANQKGDAAAVKKTQGDYQELGTAYLLDLKNFIKAHPKSAVSGYIIYKDLNSPTVPLAYAEECLAYMDKSMENTKFLKLAKKRINDTKGTQIGALATDFSQNTPDGRAINLSGFKGNYLLIDFWASWCRPCRMENPNVVAAYKRFKDKGFMVLGVSLDSNKDQWMAAIQADGLNWTQVSDLKGGNNEVAILYGIQNIPQNVLLDKEGRIIAKNLRGEALEKMLAELIP